MDQEGRDLFNIKELSKKRGECAKKIALLTPKGYSSYTSMAHTPKYLEAKLKLRSIRKSLEDLLGHRIEDDRRVGLTWKRIIEKYGISQSTLKDMRRND